MAAIHTVGLLLKWKSEPVIAKSIDVMAILREQGFEIVLSKTDQTMTPAFTRALKKYGVTTVEASQIGQKVDCLLVLGGDGTMLFAARHLIRSAGKKPVTPLVGMNLGQLGFLTELTAESFQDAFTRLKKGRYTVRERMALQVHVMKGSKKINSGVCLNEVVVHREKLARIISLKVDIQGSPLATIRCDGLIVSTPLGSTAYSMSAGGPIIHPAVHAMTLTSLNPHTLTHRPLVIPSESTVRISEAVDADQEPLFVSLDGQETLELPKGGVIEVSSDPRSLRLIDLDDKPKFFHTLREKLHWGV